MIETCEAWEQTYVGFYKSDEKTAYAWFVVLLVENPSVSDSPDSVFTFSIQRDLSERSCSQGAHL